MKPIGVFAIALSWLLGFAGAALAQSTQGADAFYRGKQLKLIVGTSSGQDYDLWARLIGRHITRHIPGEPSLVVENMPAPATSLRPIICSTSRRATAA
jgi:tripartite-type tricarboxylate transporter receptor subunit TctC